MSNAPKILFKDLPSGVEHLAALKGGNAVDAVLPDPDPADPRMSAFFIDLDANTQYHEAYGNDSAYMDLARALIGGVALRAWQQWAVRENRPDGPARRTAFVQAASDAQTGQMVAGIDDLMLRLLRRHFPGQGGEDAFDAVPFLGAMELFAKDRLPVDMDRLQRVGGGGDDVSHHRMDGFGMWFHWAAMFDCARFTVSGGGEKSHRTLFLAAAAFGSACDAAFRKRERTLPAYKDDDATTRRLRMEVLQWAQDAEVASMKARELFRAFMNVQ